MGIHIKNNNASCHIINNDGGTIFFGSVHGMNIVNGKVTDMGGRSVVDINKLKEKNITIRIEGNVDMISIPHCECITVNGDVSNVKTQSGDIEVKGDIHGNASTMSGDVICNNIDGGASTMSGDIITRR